MKVMVMVKATRDSEAGVMPTQELLTAMGQYNESLVKAGIMLAGEGLKSSRYAKRVHFAGKERTVIDGPFTETKELIAGFWLWQVRSIEEAVEWGEALSEPNADGFGYRYSPHLRTRRLWYGPHPRAALKGRESAGRS